ncbi:unnamed protein product [Meloidogyne enterolobii]|uniref:Uncharacterized protein n=1 Tax=Meloidogyne enterolobii TaxID=390850 RepID=A0ACB0ZLL7_MELEN
MEEMLSSTLAFLRILLLLRFRFHFFFSSTFFHIPIIKVKQDPSLPQHVGGTHTSESNLRISRKT